MRGIRVLRGGADKPFVVCGTTPGRPLRTARFRRRRRRASAEELILQIGALVAERQELRSRGSDEKALERNRLQIARSQWELAHALIDLHAAPA
ncbi:MAG TPA: hypothetical protein VH297_09745 [Gaiellaceae bacterium]|jgi:hypothetical protein